jgi:hypothetical protein
VILLRQTLLMLVPVTFVRLLLGLIVSAGGYVILVRVAMPGLLTTLGHGVLQTFAHGVARSAPEPHAAQTPTTV